MALEKPQLVTFPFGQGVDTKTDPKMVPMGKLLYAQNATFDTRGNLVKRYGYQQAASVVAPVALGTRDAELVVQANGQLQSYIPETGTVIPKGPIRSLNSSSRQVVKSNNAYSFPATCTNGGITLFLYQIATPSGQPAGVVATAMSESTGAIIFSDLLLDQGGSTPRMVANTNPITHTAQIVCFWTAAGGQGINCQVFGCTSLQFVGGAGGFTTIINSLDQFNPFWSVCANPNAVLGAQQLAIAWNPPNGNQWVNVSSLSSQGALINTIQCDNANAAYGLQIINTTAGNLVVAIATLAEGSPRIDAFGFNANYLPIGAQIGLDTQLPGAVRNITVGEFQDPIVDIFYELAPPVVPGSFPVAYQANTLAYVKNLTWQLNSNAPAVQGPKIFNRSVGLGSEAFRDVNGNVLVGLVFDDLVQGTWFLAQDTTVTNPYIAAPTPLPTIVSRNLEGSSHGLTFAPTYVSGFAALSIPFLPSVGQTSGSNPYGFGVAPQVAIVGVVANGSLETGPDYEITSTPGVARVTLNFLERGRSQKLGEDLHIAGGALTCFDGENVVELGFHESPQRPTVLNPCPVTLQVTQTGIGGVLSIPSKPQIATLQVPPDQNTIDPQIYSGGQFSANTATLTTPGNPSYIHIGSVYGTLNTAAYAGNHSTWWYLWFSVDGVGVDPGFETGNPGSNDVRYVRGAEVALLSSDTALIVAGKIASVLETMTVYGSGLGTDYNGPMFSSVDISPGPLYTITATWAIQPAVEGTPWVVFVTAPPIPGNSLYAYGSVANIPSGAPGGPQSAAVTVVCPFGASIASGEYFAIQSSYRASASDQVQLYCFYFVVNGNAPAVIPIVGGQVGASIPVAINSTSTPQQVAVAVKTAMATAIDAGTPVFITAPYYGPGPQPDIGIFDVTFPASVPAADLSFPNGPEPTNYSVGGALVGGTREYQVVYRWTDTKGQIHRSRPSLASEVVTGVLGPFGSVAATQGFNTLTIQTLRITAKQGVVIEIYRSQADQQVLMLVGTLANETAVDTLAFVDNVSDDYLASGEDIYTTGGVLPNDPPPPASWTLAHQGRLLVPDQENQNVIWYSQQIVQGTGVSFSDALQLRCDQGQGEILAAIDILEKVFVFKQRGILQFYGDGLDPTGTAGQGYSTPELLPTDVGLWSPDSLVRLPSGVIFQSLKGFYLLGNDGSVNPTFALDIQNGIPIGANGQPLQCTGAVLLQDRQQVRFSFGQGVPQLTYDYIEGQWGTVAVLGTGEGAATLLGQSAVLWNGLHVVQQPNGAIEMETPGAYFDNGFGIRILVQTGWIRPAGEQARCRVRHFWFLGQYFSPCLMNFGIDYDYVESTPPPLVPPNGAFGWAASVDINLQINGGSWGGGSWGDGAWGGNIGADGVLQLEGFPSNGGTSKCEAIRFTIWDTPATPEGLTTLQGQSFSLASLVLEVATIPGVGPGSGGVRLSPNKLIVG
jgi:hypothetical protein